MVAYIDSQLMGDIIWVGRDCGGTIDVVTKLLDQRADSGHNHYYLCSIQYLTASVHIGHILGFVPIR